VGMAGFLAVLALGLAEPAAAAEPPPHDRATTVWAQPGTAPLDGLGTFLYVAPPATPGPTQGPLAGYEYTLTFHLEDSSLGIVALGHKNGQKVAGFGMVPSNLISTVAYDWKYGQIYYLLTYRLSATQWGAWVYDFSAASWSLIGVQTVPGTTGRMLPEASTGVDYDAGPVTPPPNPDTTCAYYPQTDAFFYAPTGWRGEVTTQATFKEYAGYDGPCASTTRPINGWQWTTLGQAAAA
jgi:hypothetical protein